MKQIVAVSLLGMLVVGVQAQERRMVTEKIEWTWTDRPEMPDASLPNVLLVGDSITRAYYPAVAKELAGVANCYLYASATSAGDARLGPQLAEYYGMIKVRFNVVHFNNGMHGWGYTEQEYKRYFPELVTAVRKGAPGAKLVWASTTPVRKDKEGEATNARVDQRNAIADAIVSAQHIPMDDQHALMMTHQDLHQDDVHFNEEGSGLQGEQVAESVKKLLSASK